tara:strand:- start:266 stop:409 length:144 start_codon:yes stop_codon:yes gene_type:complete
MSKELDNWYGRHAAIGEYLVERELWDHYSGLPNPNWYDKSLNEDNKP